MPRSTLKKRNLTLKTPIAAGVALSFLVAPIIGLTSIAYAQDSQSTQSNQVVTTQTPTDQLSGTFYQIAVVSEPDEIDHEEAIIGVVETTDGQVYQVSGLAEETLSAVTSGAEVSVSGEILTHPEENEPGEISLASAQATIQETQTAVASSVASQTSGITPVGPNFSHGDKKVAVVLLKKGENGVADITVAKAQERYFTGSDSAANFINVTSFGKTTLSPINDPNGDIYGYLTVPEDTQCKSYTFAGQSAANAAGIDLSGYDYVSYVVDDAAVSGCGYAGYAYVNGRDQLIVSYNPGITYTGRATIEHEFGHNFGLRHASSIQCVDANNAPVALVPNNATCDLAEYGDLLDVMGSSWNSMPFSAPHKVRLGWIPQSNVSVVETSGEYDIYPASVETANAQILQIPGANANDNLYLDFRQVTNTLENPLNLYPAALNGVIIRKLDGGIRSRIIDTVPGTATAADAPLQVGQSITDPATGTKIQVMSVSATKARVKVTYADTYDQVYLRGTHNAWDTSTPMTLVPGSSHLWEATVQYTGAATDRFKFDINGDWSLNFGDNNNDGVAEQTGGDIYITQGAGTYRITFNAASKVYTVAKPPIANAGADFEVVVGKSFSFDSSASTTQGNPIVNRTWTCCEGVNVADIEANPYPNTHYTTIYEPGVYIATLKVTDAAGNYTTDTVQVTAVNDAPPVPVLAQETINVTVGENFTLDASQSYDPEGGPLSFTWGCCVMRYAQWDSFEVDDAVTTFAFNHAGTYRPRVYVTDSRGQAVLAYVTVSVTNSPNNVLPVANAGADFTVEVGQSAQFDGSGSSDADGSITSYAWNVEHRDYTGVNPTHVFSRPGQYTATLTVTDNDGAIASDTVVVTVVEPEVFTGNYAQVYLRGTHNAWANDVQMTLVANNTWQAEVSFGSTSSERFKFDINGDWTLNFGDNNNDGVVDQTGSDIAINQGAGQYRIIFNDQTKAYTITKL